MLLSDKEERLVRYLAETISRLADEIHAHGNAVTRCDLAAAEARIVTAIITAMCERIDPKRIEKITEALEKSTEPLEKAVAENQPV